ncbi:MAG TPA: GspH/FimT family pseudopilin [Steroidobacteraceae bacterium]|nr:GspH/FimT family pseudopilin [Steroidobacteraceae bacterium]
MLLNRPRGFSLVELMVTVAVLATVLAIGVPSMRTFVENGRIRAAGESWQYGLTLARNEAVRLNLPVAFVVDVSGWRVQRATDNTVLHRGSGKESTKGLDLRIDPEDASTVTYDSFSRVIPNRDGSEPIEMVDIGAARPPGSAGYRPLRLQLLSGGLVRLCDPAAEDDDPRKCL